MTDASPAPTCSICGNGGDTPCVVPLLPATAGLPDAGVAAIVPSMAFSTFERVALAVHEAGHAVAAVLCGIGVDHVTIVAKAPVPGYCRYATVSRSADAVELTALAAREAERARRLGFAPLPAEAVAAVFSDVAGAGDCDLCTAARSIAARMSAASPADLVAELRRQEDRAGAIVRDPRIASAIHDLRWRLLARGTIGGVEVEAIVAEHVGAGPFELSDFIIEETTYA